MRPVRPGDRGPAVEDIQRRLLALGYDLGRTGVDGVFLGATAEAVRVFQLEHGLAEDETVGQRTWSALVDASFSLGDRMLYLRLPHFHGNDVGIVQQALNALGFTCGEQDGIFGAFTERAVREFQRNAGVSTDGIVGPNSVRAIVNLRHVWEGKNVRVHSAAHAAPARAAEVLERSEITVIGDDEVGRDVAERLANLAHATTPRARLHVLGSSEIPPRSGTVLHVCGTGAAVAVAGRPVVRVAGAEAVVSRLLTALEAVPGTCREVVIELESGNAGDELSNQQAAVVLLDAVCAVFD